MWNNFLCKKNVVLLSTLSHQVIEECKSSLWLDMPDNSNWQPIPFTFLRICGVQAFRGILFSHSATFSPLWRDYVEQCGPGHLASSEFLQIWVMILLFLKLMSNFRVIFGVVSQWRMVHFTCRVHRTREAEREKKLREFINDNLSLRFRNNFHFRLSITLKNKTTNQPWGKGRPGQILTSWFSLFPWMKASLSAGGQMIFAMSQQFCQPAVLALAMVQLIIAPPLPH